MNCKKAIDFVDGLENRMTGFNLSTMKELVRLMEFEQGNMKIIHVAGTNGKGSVCTFVSSVLREQGYRVGSYFSPHLFSVRERIKLNGKEIKENDFAGAVEKLSPLTKKTKNKASYFEFLTMVALQVFKDKKVDFAVLETGMGGRLDATNVIKPEVCVITSISKEHNKYLGNTINRIACEKAGIIKKGVPVIAAKNNRGMNVIEKTAKEKKAELLSPDYAIKKVSDKATVVDVFKPVKLRGMEVSMLGKHQAKNAALAVAALHVLREKGHRISDRAIKKGIRKAAMKGRMQIMKKKPLVVADVAHNPAAVKAVMEAIKILKHEKLVVLFSCLRDKDVKDMLGSISADAIVVCELKGERSLAVGEIAKYCPENCVVIQDPKNAFKEAVSFASKKGLVLVLGSHYLIGEVFG